MLRMQKCVSHTITVCAVCSNSVQSPNANCPLCIVRKHLDGVEEERDRLKNDNACLREAIGRLHSERDGGPRWLTKPS